MCAYFLAHDKVKDKDLKEVIDMYREVVGEISEKSFVLQDQVKELQIELAAAKQQNDLIDPEVS